MKKNLLNSPIFYAYFITYFILFNAKGTNKIIDLIIGTLVAIFFSIVSTKLVYMFINYIKKQKNKLIYKIFLVIVLSLFVPSLIILSIYTLAIVDNFK